MDEPRTDLSLADIESRVCDTIARQTGIARKRLHPGMTLLEDLGLDSLAIFELFMDLEEVFGVTFPDEPENPIAKQVFTRVPFRVRDLAETVYLRSRPGRERRTGWTGEPDALPSTPRALFTQLGGILAGEVLETRDLYEPVAASDQRYPLFRRSTDGMQCALIPGATVEIGDPGATAPDDERPVHETRLDPFLIDVEPVSTTAFARFLNSVGELDEAVLRRWFVLAPGDRRVAHMPLERRGDLWQSVSGAEYWPMMLVSWHGANAYSLWANGRDPLREPPAASFLPSEAQWEYAARGAVARRFPWGNEPATPERARVARHRWHRSYALADLPLASVNEELGLSPFGLRHMAGNVWQWCRDDYDPGFYATPGARAPNPVKIGGGTVKSERGGSWIGPADLARSSYRRGRSPLARGRCLGFRCVGEAPA